MLSWSEEGKSRASSVAAYLVRSIHAVTLFGFWTDRFMFPHMLVPPVGDPFVLLKGERLTVWECPLGPQSVRRVVWRRPGSREV